MAAKVNTVLYFSIIRDFLGGDGGWFAFSFNVYSLFNYSL